MEQKLSIIAEKLKTPCSDLSLLQGKMGIALFFFHYARQLDYRYEEYAGQLIDEIMEGIPKMVSRSNINNIAEIGAGIEYLIQQEFISGDTNIIMEVFDTYIHRMVSINCLLPIAMRKDITGYGKYYVARLNNPDNRMKTSPGIELIKKHILQIVDSLPYYSFENIFSVIHFLPDVINLGIDRKKAGHYLNYAVDRLETVVYEDVFFGNYPGNFNPLIAAVLLFRAAAKNDDDNFAASALHFLDNYESDFRQRLSDEQAMKWSFLYHTLWKAFNRDVYKELSIQWLEKLTMDSIDSDYGKIIQTGMMLLTMNESINDDWIDLFPLY